MKTFKLIDYWGSIILIIVFTVISLIRFDATFIIGYFVVGAWQLLSMIIHATNNWFTNRAGSRFIYHWIVFGILATASAGYYFTSVLMVLLFGMLFAAPVMAVMYCMICYKELYIKMKRPLDILK